MIGDTTPDAARVQLGIYRRKSPSERCAMALTMSLGARAVAFAGIKRRHPEYDERQARMALFRLLLGDDVFRRVWPREPLVAP